MVGVRKAAVSDQNFCHGVRIVTAILSFVAVVCSVMEHNDLLFQDAPSAQSARDSAGQALGDKNTASWLQGYLEWVVAEQDSGTDGAFRQEPHTVRAVPTADRITVRPCAGACPPGRDSRSGPEQRSCDRTHASWAWSSCACRPGPHAPSKPRAPHGPYLRYASANPSAGRRRDHCA